MTLLEAVAVFLAGVGAGTINVVVGSGTLITFPTLLAVGYPPVVANVSNTIGLVPGSLAGVIGYRRELRGQGDRMLRLGAASLLGAIAGAALLLTLPRDAFDAIVPFFIVLALVLIIAQPRLNRWLTRHRPAGAEHHAALWAAVFVVGIYGGYFGAAQGILLLALFGVTLADGLHRINALKNVLAGTVNLVSGVVFVIFAPEVAWGAVALIAVGSTFGGALGSRYGRRLPPDALRVVIVVVGLFAVGRLLFFD